MALQTLKSPPKPLFAHETQSQPLHLQLKRRRKPHLGFPPFLPERPLRIGRSLVLAVSAKVGSDNGATKGEVKGADLATLGNLCVDIVLGVPSLPSGDAVKRKAYMERLSASPPDKRYWEAGGNCNLSIAAARLGLHCFALGHVGDEVYGRFLLDVLREEGIDMVGMSEDIEAAALHSADYETLLCWVLVDPFQRHGFCSRADFSKEPAFSWMNELSRQVQKAIRQSKILFCNGYVFDELSPSVIISALLCAMDAGTTTFFDPGPRGRTLFSGMPDEQKALSLYLKLSDVLLLTSDEVESLTGISNPILAGQELIKKGTRPKWVVIKMGGKGSILITTSNISCAPSFKVDVVDTVGCGDSFTAAVAYGYLHRLSPLHTLVLANAVGAATATGCGAGRNVASLDKVLELLRESNINEDDGMWSDIVHENSETPEIMALSKNTVNGSNSRIAHVSIQKVVSELLPKLESIRKKQAVPS